MSATCLHKPSSLRPSGSDIDHIVSIGSARAERAGQRMTDSRRRVLELLVSAAEPLKAYDLVDRFYPDGRSAKPPTVYCALEFLERLGLLHRISSTSSYVACSVQEDGAHAAAFLICGCCGATQEVHAPDRTGMTKAAASRGYTIDRVSIEVLGVCARCQRQPDTQ